MCWAVKYISCHPTMRARAAVSVDPVRREGRHRMRLHSSNPRLKIERPHEIGMTQRLLGGEEHDHERPARCAFEPRPMGLELLEQAQLVWELCIKHLERPVPTVTDIQIPRAALI